MAEAFDGYYKWLAIPPYEQPPSHYRLLGLALFEADPDVLANAADKQMAHVRSFQAGQHSALSQKILNEIAAARICLLNAAKKAEYDEKLREQLAALEGQSPQTAFFDPAEVGLDVTTPKPLPVARQPRRAFGRKLPWQLPAAIAAGLLTSVAIIAYLIATKSPEGEKPGAQAKANALSKKESDGAKPNEKTQPKPEPPHREPQPPRVEPGPDPRPGPGQPKPEVTHEAQPKPKPEPKPEPVAEAPEKSADRVKDAFAKAKTVADFRVVALDARKLIDQANSVGKQDVAKSLVVLALAAARKAEDEELVKTAAMYVLEPETKHVATVQPRVYLDDLKEFDVHVGWGTLGKHGNNTDPGDMVLVNGKVPLHSLFPHPPSDGASSVSYDLAAQFSRFHSTVAIADDARPYTSQTFRVRGDGRVLWESNPMKDNKSTQECDIPVGGVRVLTLDVYCPGANTAAGTVWVDPFLVRQISHSFGARATVPDAAAQKQALKLVQEAFTRKSAVAITSEWQRALAQELIETAKSTRGDMTAQYVTFTEAGRWAVKAKDADLAFRVVEEMGARFDIDTFDLKVKSLTAICKSRLLPQESNALVGKALDLMQEAGLKDRSDTLKSLGGMALDLAKKSKDAALLKETSLRIKLITKDSVEIQNTKTKALEAVAALDKHPTDPAANLAAGKYRCFARNQWSQGISMLALGDDPVLKDLAVKELKGLPNAPEQMKLADDWWSLADAMAGLAKQNTQRHAAFWYRQALPGLTGLLKDKAERRLRECPGQGSADRFD